MTGPDLHALPRLEREIPSRLIGLGRILLEINGTYRVTFFQDRFRAQKAMFLYQALHGIDLGYFYVLDDFGVYSSRVRDDYREAFSIIDTEMDDRVQAFQFKKRYQVHLQTIRDLLVPPPEFQQFVIGHGLLMTRPADALERLWPELLTAYMHMLKEFQAAHPHLSGHEVRAERMLAQRYPDFADVAPILLRRLQALKLPLPGLPEPAAPGPDPERQEMTP